MEYQNCETSARYCDFTLDISNDYVQIEHCKFCHRSVRYRKIGGRIDNNKYLFDHIRDFCQSQGSTATVYEFIYGRQHVKNREKTAKEKEVHERRRDDLHEGAVEYIKSWKRSSTLINGFKKNESP